MFVWAPFIPATRWSCSRPPADSNDCWLQLHLVAGIFNKGSHGKHHMFSAECTVSHSKVSVLPSALCTQPCQIHLSISYVTKPLRVTFLMENRKKTVIKSVSFKFQSCMILIVCMGEISWILMRPENLSEWSGLCIVCPSERQKLPYNIVIFRLIRTSIWEFKFSSRDLRFDLIQ